MSRSVMTGNSNATLPSGIHHEGPWLWAGQTQEELMLARVGSLVILASLGADLHGVTAKSPSAADPGTLTVHEWGTFTTVAGPDGLAVDWLPLGGPIDLPCFVEHFQDRRNIKLAPNQPLPVDYATAR